MSEAPLRVLIVEENQSNAKLIELELQRGGLVFCSTRVDTELHFVAALVTEPDVVFSDWQLPQFNALRALELLRERWPHTPFILVSGPIGEEAAVNIIKLGASDYLHKDRLTRLVPAVEEALGQRAVEASALRVAVAYQYSERLLTDSQRVARLGSWTWEPPTGRVWWSDALYDLFEIERGSVRPSFEAFLERVHPDDRPVAMRRVEAALAGADGFAGDLRILIPNGRLIWVHSRAQATRDGAGRVLRMEGTDQDITERKRTEESLREERDRLAMLAATVPGVLCSFRLRPDGTASFPYSAPGIRSLYGLSPEQLADDAAPIFKIMHPADAEYVRETIAESARTLNPWFATYRLCRLGCEEIWIEGNSTPVREADGGTLWHGFVSDVTKRKKDEEVLRFQHALLRSQSEASPDGILIVGPDNRVLSYNRRFLTIWGAPEEMLAARDDIPVLALARRQVAEPQVFGARVEAIYADRNASSQDEVTLADGRVLDRYSAPIRGDSQDYLGRVWYFRDITDRKRSEVALRESEERYRRLIDMLPEAVFIFSDERLVFCNPAGLRLLGAGLLSQVLGRTPFDLFHQDDHALVRQRHASMLETCEAAPGFEANIVRLDGRLAPVHVVATPIIDRGENAILVAISDLTDRERSVALLGSVLNSVNDAIITINDQGLIQAVNPATEDLFGYPDSELVGANFRDLMPAPFLDDQSGELTNSRQAGNANLIGIGREVIGRRKDGSTFPLELTVTEFRLDGERHFTGVVRDITARKRLEEQFHQAQKMEAVGQLAGGVAHDFNNLLTVINGYSEMLLSNCPAADPRKGQLQCVREAGERAAGLTAQLLAFSRKTIVAPRILDLNELIEHLGKMLRRLIGEDITFATVLAPGPLPIKADPGQCEQVFMNLAVNARDAMPRGGRLTIETVSCVIGPDELPDPKLQPGRYVKVRLSDTGSGMPPEVQKRIFEPFFTTKEQGKGTGLGLATVYGIVLQSGGGISVESEVGRGTTFTILFPAILAPKSQEQSHRHEEFAPRGTETVLVVEDEEAVLKVTRILLETQGYTVIPANSGAEALAAAETHAGVIDLLLTDVILPGTGGRELAEAVRSQQPAMRVLYMSGYTGDAVLRYGVETATDSLVQKPFTPLVLARKVRQSLDSSPSALT